MAVYKKNPETGTNVLFRDMEESIIQQKKEFKQHKSDIKFDFGKYQDEVNGRVFGLEQRIY